MGLKKYEIITVGSDKRVRALRSWAVGDRYVNIGDVGGIVYDEKTLSQDGACWLFRGNFGFPGARIGGDSIVHRKILFRLWKEMNWQILEKKCLVCLRFLKKLLRMIW